VSTKNFDAYLEVNSGAEKTRLAVLEEEQRNSVEAIIMPATPAPTAQAPAAQVQAMTHDPANILFEGFLEKRGGGTSFFGSVKWK